MDLLVDKFEKLIVHTKTLILASPGESQHIFRLRQFQNALRVFRQSSDSDLSEICQTKGIGKGIQRRIEEICTTGHLQELDQEIVFPEFLRICRELETINGIGPVRSSELVLRGITGIPDLREKINQGLIETTLAQRVGLKYHQDLSQRIPRGEITQIAREIRAIVRQKLDPEMRVIIAGSYRRGSFNSGDIDLILTHTETDYDLRDIIACLHQSGHLTADLTRSTKGQKYLGITIHPRYQIARRIDLFWTSYADYAASLLHYTGSKQTNIRMSLQANKLGLKLTEHGLFRDGQKILTQSEAEIYHLLEMPYEKPEHR